MIKTDEQIEAKVRERFELMAVRWANHRGLSSAEKFSELPPQIREQVEQLKYSDLIRPLVLHDHAHGMSVRGLSIKYARSISSIQENYLNRSNAQK